MKKTFSQNANRHLYLIANWGNIVGEKFSKTTKLSHVFFPSGKKNQGKLFIKIKNAHIGFLNYCVNDILQQVNAFYGYPAFSSIRFVFE